MEPQKEALVERMRVKGIRISRRYEKRSGDRFSRGRRPGQIDELSVGLTTSQEDIFDELPTLRGEVLAKKFIQLPDMTDAEKNITALFSAGPMQVDQLSRAAGLPVSELMELLLALELKGVVRELSGKRFVLVEEYA